jgi:hypothetical protein
MKAKVITQEGAYSFWSLHWFIIYVIQFSSVHLIIKSEIAIAVSNQP